MSLPPLATADDIAQRMGRDLTGAEISRVMPLLADASAQIRRYCRRDFLLHTVETGVFRGHRGVIELPDKTTTAVSLVVAIGGGGGVPDFPIPFFTFDGIDKIRLGNMAPVINVPEAWWEIDAYPGTYRVTRDYGYAQVPDDVLAVCANAVIGVLTAPTMAAGIISETIGPYSYRLEKSGGGVSVALTQADLASLSDYRTKATSIVVSTR